MQSKTLLCSNILDAKQEFCSKFMGAKRNFCLTIIGDILWSKTFVQTFVVQSKIYSNMWSTKLDFCYVQTFCHGVQSKRFRQTFWVQSKTFVQNVLVQSKTFVIQFKHFGCKARLLFKIYGFKKKLLFDHYRWHTVKQDFFSNVCGAKQVFFQTFGVQS